MKTISKKVKYTIAGLTGAVVIGFAIIGGVTVWNALREGSVQLRDGAQAIYEGSNQLSTGMDGVNKVSAGLYDGLVKYTDGVAAVGDGVVVLSQGASQYTNGVHTLAAGTQTLDNGLQQLVDGSAQLSNVTAMLDEKSELLLQAPDMIASGLSQLKQGLAIVPTQDQISLLTAGSTQAKNSIAGLSSGISVLYQGINGVNGALQQIQPMYNNSYDSLMQTIASAPDIDALKNMLNDQTFAAIKAAAQTYTVTENAISSLTGIMNGPNGNDGIATLASTIQSGASTLNNLYGTLDAGVQKFAALPGGVQQINQGIDGMIALINDKEKGLATGLKTYVTGVKGVNQGAQTLYNGLATAKNGAQALRSGANVLNASSAPILNGIGTLQTGVHKLVDLKGGLLDAGKIVKDGSQGLHDGVTTLTNGIKSLKEGTEGLYQSLGGK